MSRLLVFVLISTLIASGLVAAIITDVCFNIYVAIRLFALVREKGVSGGLSACIEEIWNHFSAFTSDTFAFPRYAVRYGSIEHQRSRKSTEDTDDDKVGRKS